MRNHNLFLCRNNKNYLRLSLNAPSYQVLCIKPYIHVFVFQLCLLSKNMKPALQFMDVDITDISKEVSRVLVSLSFDLSVLICSEL